MVCLIDLFLNPYQEDLYFNVGYVGCKDIELCMMQLNGSVR